MNADKLLNIAAWIGSVVALLCAILLIFWVTTANAASTTQERTTPFIAAYEQGWERKVAYCVSKVETITGSPIRYVMSRPGVMVRYTDNREERLLMLCLDLVGAQK